MSITETVLSLKFVTQARLPSGVMATPKGPFPTATVATTAGGLAVVSITETVLSAPFAT